MQKQSEFIPKSIPLEITKDRLTDSAGLGTMIDIFNSFPSLVSEVKKCLPARTSNKSSGAYSLFLQLLASVVYGHDCLDDLGEFADEDNLSEIFNDGISAPRTMGDFLYDFSDENILKLKDFLKLMATHIREHMQKTMPDDQKPKDLRINQDSTSHIQSGEKIEGLAFNFKNEWCIDSQSCYDELGLIHDFDLRSGSTYSSVGAVDQINRCFAHLKFTEEKFYSADSAFCNQDVITKLISSGVQFTITAHDNMHWSSRVDEITNWQPWVYSEEELKKFATKKQSPPEIEMGRWHYRPTWSESLMLPVIVKRTRLEKQQASLFTEAAYKYYAVITNFNLAQSSYQSVIEFHNKRGHFCENFIREAKHNMDLKHFPCLKMNANFAYGLVAMIAHNLLRWVAYVERPDKPQFAKKLRRRFIFVPGKIVTHARRTVLKVKEKYFQEVMRIRQAWELQPYPSTLPIPAG